MKPLLSTFLAALALFCSCSDKEPDLLIYGGTSSGVVAAYSAARQGLKVVVVEPLHHIGGMTTGGLGLTDIGNKQVVYGLARKFYRDLGARYGTLESWIFEPSAASEIFDGYLSDPNITVLSGYRLAGVDKDGTRIAGIAVTDGSDTLSFKAGWYLDCSYEGDLMARAGVSYHRGREANETYGETWNGVQLLHEHQLPDGIDPYVIPGDKNSGLLWGISDRELLPNGSGDSLVQAYNYRICLTDSTENRIPITRPDNYDPARYELLLRLIAVTHPEKPGLGPYFIWSRMPGRKTDINNRGGFSTDMIGMNWDYPEADWERRREIIQAHRDYTLGLLWFIGHDERVPADMREEMLRWGLPKDEYTDNGGWTPQLYVRESRRMVGEYVATQADCENRTVVEDAVGMAAYTMDSHNCERIVVHKDGRDMVKNEGNAEIRGGLPYNISYRSITPRREECTNLLVPVCLSASHIAYGSIRMEPVFMVLGQAAALAVSIAREERLEKIQDVDSRKIRKVFAEDPYQDGTAPDILIDDTDARVVSGDLRTVKVAGCYGPGALQGPSDEARAEFAATVSRDGRYDIYSYEQLGDRWAEEKHFRISSPGQESDYIFYQKDLKVAGQTKGAWVKIGSRELKAGEEIRIEAGTPSRGRDVRYDAILLCSR